MPLIVAFLTVPSIVRGLGSERFGILSIGLVILGSMAIFDLGLGRAATRFVAEALGTGRDERISAIAWTAVLVQASMGMLGAAVLFFATPSIVGRLLNVPGNLVVEARSAFYVLAFSVPVVLVYGSFRGILEAAQRFDLVNAVALPIATANYVVPLVGVVLGWSLMKIVLFLVIARCAALAVLYVLCLHSFPSLAKLGSFHRHEAETLLRFGGWVMVSNFVGPLLIYLDRFMLGALFTMSAVAYYSAPYDMITRLGVVPASLVGTLFPALTAVSSRNEMHSLQGIVGDSVRYLVFLLAPVVIGVMSLSGDILRLWLGRDFAQQSGMALQVVAVGVLANAIAQVPFALIQARNRPDVTAKIHLFELPVQFGLAWTLVSLFGIRGAAIAWTLRTVLDAVLLFVLASRITSIPSSRLIERRVTIVVTSVIALGALGAALSARIQIPPLRFAMTGVYLAAVVVVLWCYFLDARDRERLVRLARNVGRR